VIPTKDVGNGEREIIDYWCQRPAGKQSCGARQSELRSHAIASCEAIDLVLQKSETGKIYNIAANQELKNLQVAKTAETRQKAGEPNRIRQGQNWA
jgi:hypothetical protein